MSDTELFLHGVEIALPRILGHFLWEAAALGLLAAISQRLFWHASASVRCAILTLCLLALPICAGVTLSVIAQQTSFSLPADNRHSTQVNSQHEASPATVLSMPKYPELPDAAHGVYPESSNPVPGKPQQSIPAALKQTVSSVTHATVLTPPADHWKAAIAIAYFTGVSLMLLRLCLGVRGSISLKKHSWPVTQQDLIAACSRQLSRTRIRRRPQLLFCKQVLAPAVVGIVKPAILLPISICSDLSIDQIELLLVHELAHIRRHDQLLDLVQRMIEAFFFFHPAVWFISLAIRTEREKCCDDIVLRQGHNHLDYAGVLVRVAQLGFSPQTALTQSATGRRSQLRHRILRLIGSDAPRDLLPSRTAAVTILFVILSAAFFGVRLLGSRPAKADSPPATMPAPPSPYHIVFDNGVSVDVLAVSVVPSRDKPFWTPDGAHIIESPYTSLDGAYALGEDNKLNCELTVQVNGLTDNCEFLGVRAGESVSIKYASAYQSNPSNPTPWVFKIAVPNGTALLDLELGMSTINWQPAGSFKSPGEYGEGPNKLTVVDPTPRELRVEPNVEFYVMLPATVDAPRLLAIDDAGKVHVSSGECSRNMERWLIQAVFPDLPSEKVKEYRVEVNRNPKSEWKPVKGIHTRPIGDRNAMVAQCRLKRLTAREQQFQPVHDNARIEKDVETIDRMGGGFDGVDEWTSSIRDLADIGPPAVPAIVQEMRRTGRNGSRVAYAIALRAIDDPRAVPGLIDGLGDCPTNLGSFGASSKDPALAHFMLGLGQSKGRSDRGPPDRRFFTWSGSFDEMTRTLEVVTDHYEPTVTWQNHKQTAFEASGAGWQNWLDQNRASLVQGLPSLRGESASQPLHVAISKGQLAEVQKLVAAGADVNQPGTNGWTPLHLAAAIGQIEIAQFLLDHKARVDLRTSDGCTPLQTAFGLGTLPTNLPLPEVNLQIVQLLLANNTDTRSVNASGQTALYGAAAYDDVEAMQLLLDQGALVNAKDARGRTALHRAVECRRAGVVNALISAGADVNAKDAAGLTPIQMGSLNLTGMNNNSDIVRTLLAHGADISLSSTIALGSVEQLAEALKKNPPLNEKSKGPDDQMPLERAINQRSPEKVKLLLDAGADPNVRFYTGNAPLHIAVMQGNAQVLAMLIAAKADVNGLGQGDCTPLFWGCNQSKPDMVKLLLDAGANPNSTGTQYDGPISIALQGKTPQAKAIITVLLAHGADINDKGRRGMRPIFWANPEMAQFIMDRGARIDVAGNDGTEGETPLHYAAVLSQADKVKFLLAHHAALEAKNAKGETPLAHCVRFYPQNGVVKILLDAGADVSARDNDGNTPLHAAAIQGSLESVTLLLNKGADPNAKDNDGLTPLHEASKLGSDELIQRLLKHGADAGAVDAGGRTPLQWATKESTIGLLRSHGPTTAPKG